MTFTRDLPPDWKDAIHAILTGKARRIVVIGPTDAGKSSFILAAAEALAARRPVLVDCDPGQKMIGGPGTVSRGTLAPEGFCQDRFVFIGSTSAILIGKIAAAVQRLTSRVNGPVLVNTPGFIAGPGVRLQSAIIKAAAADCLVMIGAHTALEEIAASNTHVATVRLERSQAAMRKSDGTRRALRLAAFEAAFEDAKTITMPTPSAHFEPGAPLAWLSERRPVCSLADERGTDLALGILTAADDREVEVFTSAASASVIRLGRMWAEPRPDGGWKLVDRLSETWLRPEEA